MNLSAAQKHLSQDPRLKPLIEKIEAPQFTPGRDVYFDLLESIVSQQLSVKVADVIFGRFVNLFSDKKPLPELVVACPFEQLRSVGLSNQKASYIQNTAQFFIEKDLKNTDWSSQTETEILQTLTQIKGVGKWTVEMIMMFSLGKPDVFPIDDLGIQQAMIKLYQIEETGKSLRTKMLEIAEPWRPYRTTASRYLWRWKDLKSVD